MRRLTLIATFLFVCTYTDAALAQRAAPKPWLTSIDAQGNGYAVDMRSYDAVLPINEGVSVFWISGDGLENDNYKNADFPAKARAYLAANAADWIAVRTKDGNLFIRKASIGKISLVGNVVNVTSREGVPLAATTDAASKTRLRNLIGN